MPIFVVHQFNTILMMVLSPSKDFKILSTSMRTLASTFKEGDGGTIHMFHLYNSPRETEWQCTFTTEMNDVPCVWSS